MLLGRSQSNNTDANTDMFCDIPKNMINEQKNDPLGSLAMRINYEDLCQPQFVFNLWLQKP